ncbi:hypothetical protein [Actinomadura coerulea]|uniref:hypothetical protein n=1 Tax=Actinomadura coerulea TaxID=46159 RepID=UPI00341C93A5
MTDRTRQPVVEPTKDARFARDQADACLRYEVDRPGRAGFINVGTGPEPHWLPRTEAIPYYHALAILVHCEGDLRRIQDTARLCRRRASQVAPTGTRYWTRAAELCDQAIEEFFEHGAATDDKARRKLMIRAEFIVSTWHVGWMMSRREARSELKRLNRDLAAVDADQTGTGADKTSPWWRRPLWTR